MEVRNHHINQCSGVGSGDYMFFYLYKLKMTSNGSGPQTEKDFKLTSWPKISHYAIRIVLAPRLDFD